MTSYGIEQVWEETGMKYFVPRQVSYQSQDYCLIVDISQIKPVQRSMAGYIEGCEIPRIKRICEEIISGEIIHPIEVQVTLNMDSQYRYELRHGYHRLYVSRKAGFSKIPVVILDRI